MNREQFTKGPWFSAGTSTTSIDIQTSNPYKWIASVLGTNVGRSLEETEANARLIACAPEMYEVLKSILENATMQRTFPATLKEIQALLNRITGVQECDATKLNQGEDDGLLKY